MSCCAQAGDLLLCVFRCDAQAWPEHQRLRDLPILPSAGRQRPAGAAELLYAAQGESMGGAGACVWEGCICGRSMCVGGVCMEGACVYGRSPYVGCVGRVFVW